MLAICWPWFFLVTQKKPGEHLPWHGTHSIMNKRLVNLLFSSIFVKLTSLFKRSNMNIRSAIINYINNLNVPHWQNLLDFLIVRKTKLQFNWTGPTLISSCCERSTSKFIGSHNRIIIWSKQNYKTGKMRLNQAGWLMKDVRQLLLLLLALLFLLLLLLFLTLLLLILCYCCCCCCC